MFKYKNMCLFRKQRHRNLHLAHRPAHHLTHHPVKLMK